MLAIIGGSGLTQLSNLEVQRREVARTPYGEPSGALTFGRLAGRDVVFMARHGHGHTIPPHEVNYRANMWALQAAGVSRVVSVASVGGIRADLVPGSIVLPHQILDYTYGRKMTYVSGEDGLGKEVRHIDFTHPYCAELRAECLKAGQRIKLPLIDGGVYAATQGPRLETAAEVNRLERDGADMIGMTGMPEAALARELGLNYAAISVVANYAAGRHGSERGIVMTQVGEVLQEAMVKVRELLVAVVESAAPAR